MSAWLWASLACNLLLAVGCLVTLGWGISYQNEAKQLSQRVRSLNDPDPLCGCSHHISFHDGDGCHFTTRYYREGKLGPRASITTCPCVRYVGPEPLPRYIDWPNRKEEE